MNSSKKFSPGEILNREIEALQNKLDRSEDVHLEGGGSADAHLLDVADELAASRPQFQMKQGNRIGHSNYALMVAGLGIATFLVTLFVLRNHPNLAVVLTAEGAIWMVLIGLASKFLDAERELSAAQQARITAIAKVDAMIDGIRSVSVMPGLSDEAKLAALKVLQAMAPPKGD